MSRDGDILTKGDVRLAFSPSAARYKCRSEGQRESPDGAIVFRSQNNVLRAELSSLSKQDEVLQTCRLTSLRKKYQRTTTARRHQSITMQCFQLLMNAIMAARRGLTLRRSSFHSGDISSLAPHYQETSSSLSFLAFPFSYSLSI
jgi:hypothetical protein